MPSAPTIVPIVCVPCGMLPIDAGVQVGDDDACAGDVERSPHFVGADSGDAPFHRRVGWRDSLIVGWLGGWMDGWLDSWMVGWLVDPAAGVVFAGQGPVVTCGG